MNGFALFTTAIGECGIAWNDAGIAGIQLPEADAGETRARLARRFPGAEEQTPPEQVQAVIAAIQALLRGEAVDLSHVQLDMQGIGEFERRVYEIARTIPAGATLAYGEIAARLGDPGLARAVGQAMGRNPFPIIVPCHRVIGADGRPGGFSANGGAGTKLRLLDIESAQGSLPFG